MRSFTFTSANVIGVMLLAASPVEAETVQGQTILASYQAPGLCAENDRASGELHLAVCAPKSQQEFHMETFNDIAQQVSWQKIMNGKNCLQAGWISRQARLLTERCYITTWSKPAFWSVHSTGHMFSQEQYCFYRKDGGSAIGSALIADKCRWSEAAEFYPAVLTRSAQVGPATLAAYTPGQQLKAIVVDGAYSGGNLVASDGAFLKIDKAGKVSVTNGGAIIAGGAGHLIRDALSRIAGSMILMSKNVPGQTVYDYSPRTLDFFNDSKDHGKITYELR